MPFKCCVPNCRGNYDNGPKVSVFSFPCDLQLQTKWLEFIKRDSYKITKNSRVCELHFRPEEVLKEEVVYDKKRDISFFNKLDRPKLEEGAVPSLLFNLTKQSNFDKPREVIYVVCDQVVEREDEEMQQVSIESLVDSEFEVCEENMTFNNFEEFEGYLKNTNVLNDHWSVQYVTKKVIFLIFDFDFVPKVRCSVTVDENCILRAFTDVVKLESIDNVELPCKLTNIRHLNLILNYMLETYGKDGPSSVSFS